MTDASPADDGAHSAVLEIDLGALAANYRRLRDLAAPAICAAVVKADGYGLGAIPVARTLAAQGCDTFFVATYDEAVSLRDALSVPVIYVLNGLSLGLACEFARQRLRPVLGSIAEISEWAAFCQAQANPLPAAIHIDTGMNRLGIDLGEARMLGADRGLLSSFTTSLVMSHLACADDPVHPMNERQLEAFSAVRTLMPPAPLSLSASAGTLRGPAFHFDMVRPGVALYGGRSLVGATDMASVVRARARIISVREAHPGESVGYGAAYSLKRPSRIATIALGYADGVIRKLGASDSRLGAVAHINGHAAPFLGRVSMDLITLDVTDVPAEKAQRGAWAEILGDHTGVDDLAQIAGTIGYEILTSLGARYTRVYVSEREAN
jgi:alanine racemase